MIAEILKDIDGGNYRNAYVKALLIPAQRLSNRMLSGKRL
jgi:hypothetical protein